MKIEKKQSFFERLVEKELVLNNQASFDFKGCRISQNNEGNLNNSNDSLPAPNPMIPNLPESFIRKNVSDFFGKEYSVWDILDVKSIENILNKARTDYSFSLNIPNDSGDSKQKNTENKGYFSFFPLQKNGNDNFSCFVNSRICESAWERKEKTFSMLQQAKTIGQKNLVIFFLLIWKMAELMERLLVAKHLMMNIQTGTLPRLGDISLPLVVLQ